MTTTTHPTWCAMPDHCEDLGHHIALRGGVDTTLIEGALPGLEDTADTPVVVRLHQGLDADSEARIVLDLGCSRGCPAVGMTPKDALRLAAMLTNAYGEVEGGDQ